MNAGRALIRFLCAALALLSVTLIPTPAAAQTDDADVSRQILVMLRLPAPHRRLNEGYSGGYGDSASRAGMMRVAAGIARRTNLRIVEDWPMPLIGVHCVVMEAQAGRPLDDAIRTVSRQRQVEWAQPMQTYRSQSGGAAVDRLYATQPSVSAWHLTQLHRVATGRGVTVAMVDSGVDVNHPDLTGQFAAVQDFIGGRTGGSEAHGTGVAGVIAARRNNGVGIVGIAPSARLIALRACRETAGRDTATCTTLNIARALHYAIDQEAAVINLSLSGPHDQLLERLVGVALRRNSVVVAAYDPNLPSGGFPASQRGVIAVGDAALPALPATVYGAPARDIPTTQPGGTWHLVNGSSFAAAHVSGLMALLRERERPPRLIRASSGAIDACATFAPVTRSCDCTCAINQLLGGRTHH